MLLDTIRQLASALNCANERRTKVLREFLSLSLSLKRPDSSSERRVRAYRETINAESEEAESIETESVETEKTPSAKRPRA